MNHCSPVEFRLVPVNKQEVVVYTCSNHHVRLIDSYTDGAMDGRLLRVFEGVWRPACST